MKTKMKKTLSEEHKYKIGLAHKGKKHSEEWNKNLSIARIGIIPWSKGKKFSEEHKRNIGARSKGRIPSEETRKKMSIARTGQKRSEETRKKMSVSAKKGEPHFNQRGENHPNWRGGTSTLHAQIRGSLEYKLWQDSVKNRDGNKCQKCGETRISMLMGHHIVNFSSYPELRLAIDNGITFCRPCHKEFHKKYGFKNNTREQLEEFLTK